MPRNALSNAAFAMQQLQTEPQCLRRLQAAGMTRVSVSTEETNTPARRLHESVGFRIVNRYLNQVKPAGGQV